MIYEVVSNGSVIHRVNAILDPQEGKTTPAVALIQAQREYLSCVAFDSAGAVLAAAPTLRELLQALNGKRLRLQRGNAHKGSRRRKSAERVDNSKRGA